MLWLVASACGESCVVEDRIMIHVTSAHGRSGNSQYESVFFKRSKFFTQILFNIFYIADERFGNRSKLKENICDDNKSIIIVNVC